MKTTTTITIILIFSAIPFMIMMLPGEKCLTPAFPISADFKAICDGLRLFHLHAGRWPVNIDELMERPAGLENWEGPYFNKKPLDPWGNEYLYFINERYIAIASFGADAAPGGEDENKDYFHAMEIE